MEYSYIELESNNKSLENKLNDFFVTSVNEIVSSIPQPTVDLPKYKIPLPLVHNSFNTIPKISINRLQSIIFNMTSKATGENVITVKIMKELFDVIGYPLLNIVNTSLQTGRVPTRLKCSTVIPVPKISRPTRPENLRPINLLPIVDKLMEIVVYKELNNYLKDNEILFAGQSVLIGKYFRISNYPDKSATFATTNIEIEILNDIDDENCNISLGKF
ncbi:hypothetical protein FQR65_LT14547 [Abscondita terminalis]|nr:hypothetical protein FQR65_LT14547 [Abscondita terminalis]